MIHKLRPLIALVVIGSLVGGAYWYFSHNPQKWAALQVRLGLISPAEAAGVYQVSGYIEADAVRVAAEAPGRIMELAADEGDFVEAGQILLRLDTSLLEAQLLQAEARIATAKANLVKVRAGLPAEEIDIATANVALAQATAQAAYVRWQDTKLLRDNPQELDMQIAALRTAIDLSALQVAASIPLKDASETMYQLGQQQWEYAYDEHRQCMFIPQLSKRVCMDFTLPEGVRQDAGVAWNMAGTNRWEAWVNLNSAMTAQVDVQAQLNALLRIRNDPQAAQLQVAQAEAAYQTALADVEVAQARLETMKAGVRPEQVAIAEARLQQAQAALVPLQVQHEKSVLSAPLSAWVTKRTVNEGEMAVPGATLLTLADLNNLTLTVYVPEPDVSLVSLGQRVTVFVDAFPGKPFTGIITYINDQAEFTPKNVQTKEERVNTVFAVKLKLDNQEQLLKPGMPADAILK